MWLRIVGMALALVGLCTAADKGLGEGRAMGKLLDVRATLYNDKKDVQALLGHKIEDDIVVIDVTIKPRGDEPFKLWLDDFFIRSDKDGQRTEPASPSELAGSSVITLVYTHEAAPVMQRENGPVWGDPTGGQPRRLPGQGAGVGNPTSTSERTEARVNEPAGETNPLLAVLKSRAIEDGEISQPVNGLMYFLMDGKHKVKHLELHYRGQSDKLDIRFRRPK